MQYHVKEYNTCNTLTRVWGIGKSHVKNRNVWVWGNPMLNREICLPSFYMGISFFPVFIELDVQ
jgi:hypothetical protein